MLKAFAELVGYRSKEPLEGGDVGLDPLGAIDDPRSRWTSEGTQTGLCRYEVLSLFGQLREVRLEQPALVPGQLRLAARNPASNVGRGVP
jgi:hypothetical protein